MPWRHTLPEEERLQFIVETFDGLSSVADLCRSFGISRKTAHKWLTRFDTDGPAGLVDRSRAPHSHPHAVAAEVVEQLLAVRKRHPRWGPRKILAWLARRQPALALPAASTVATVLQRHGLVTPRRTRRRVPPGLSPFAACGGPNDVWAVDFKGQFRLGDGTPCYPLTITDSYSRYLLCCTALTTTAAAAAIAVFEAVFRQYGLPTAIRSDNGTPFASTGLGGMSALSVWWLRLGIRHDRIEPGRPDQNGRHERMHLALKQEAVELPKANRQAQQRTFDHFRRSYNEERPHEALGQKTPASLYTPSSRPLPATLPPLVYPISSLTRHTDYNGRFAWGDRPQVALGKAFAHQPIGLEEVEEGVWVVRFGTVVLGTLTAGQHTVVPPHVPRRRRRRSRH